jgi:uncharacterized protein (DUF1778 family)
LFFGIAFAGGMKNLAKEGARITLQISARLLQRLQEAAELRGITLKQFVVQAAQREADQIIAREKGGAAPEDAAPRLGEREQPGSENDAPVPAPEQEKTAACNGAPGAAAASGADDRDCA